MKYLPILILCVPCYAYIQTGQPVYIYLWAISSVVLLAGYAGIAAVKLAQRKSLFQWTNGQSGVYCKRSNQGEAMQNDKYNTASYAAAQRAIEAKWAKQGNEPEAAQEQPAQEHESVDLPESVQRALDVQAKCDTIMGRAS